jgi:FAD dependent oxidoreductase TIGR03364
MSSARVIVIGAGVLGTMHALSALERGCDVVHLDREADARGASVRNFGLVWVSGRASGIELELALAARARWEAIAEGCPGIGFRANGSLTLAANNAELALMAQACEQADASTRGFSLLDADEVRALNPTLAGEFVGGLHCSQDAGVEPRLVPRALRRSMEETGRYRFVPGADVVDVRTARATTATGEHFEGDRIFVCTGAAHQGLGADVLADAPVRRVRLQMFETEPFGQQMTTSLADGDSLRYYPAFDLPGRAGLGPQDPVAEAHHMQLLCQQRLDGSLTIGDTHHYDEPFAFDLDEAPTTYLVNVVERLLGQRIPRIARRWAGVYSQITFDREGPVYLRRSLDDGVELVTGPGGRGMTLAPAIAEESFR